MALVSFIVSFWARNVPESCLIFLLAIFDVTWPLPGVPLTCFGIFLMAPVSTRALSSTVCATVSAAMELKLLPAPKTTTASPSSGAIANEAW